MYVLQSYRFAVFAEQWIKTDAFLLVLSEITVMDIINVTNTLNSWGFLIPPSQMHEV